MAPVSDDPFSPWNDPNSSWNKDPFSPAKDPNSNWNKPWAPSLPGSQPGQKTMADAANVPWAPSAPGSQPGVKTMAEAAQDHQQNMAPLQRALQDSTQQRNLFNQVSGMQSNLTPAMIAGMQHNAQNTPFLQANGQDRGAMDGQNGGGQMGGYGNAAQTAIQAGAGVQAQMGLNSLNADIGKYQDSFNQNKAGLLDRINAGAFNNDNALYTGGFNQDLANRQLNAQQGNIGWDHNFEQQQRQDRLDMNRDNNVAAGVNGAWHGLGGFLSNPAATTAAGAAIGSIVPGVGTVIGGGLGAAVGGIGSMFSGSQAPGTTPGGSAAPNYNYGSTDYGPNPAGSGGHIYPTPGGGPLSGSLYGSKNRGGY